VSLEKSGFAILPDVLAAGEIADLIEAITRIGDREGVRSAVRWEQVESC